MPDNCRFPGTTWCSEDNEFARCAHTILASCSLIFSSSFFMPDDQMLQRAPLCLGTEGVDLTTKFLGDKIELLGFHLHVPLEGFHEEGAMLLESYFFFVDIQAVEVIDDFLFKPVGIHLVTVHVFIQFLLHAVAYIGKPFFIMCFDLIAHIMNGCRGLVEVIIETPALMLPEQDQLVDRFIDCLQHGLPQVVIHGRSPCLSAGYWAT